MKWFDNYDFEAMGLDYNTYKEFCENNDIEPKAIDSEAYYNWLYDESEAWWDDFMYEVKAYDKRHYNHYLVSANLGLWSGRRAGFNIFDTLEEAIQACVNNMDYIIIDEDKVRGVFDITCIHHDGSNHFTIKAMTDEGYNAYDDWLWLPIDESFDIKDEYFEAIRFSA